MQEPGWWNKALSLPSPNQNPRPPGVEVDLLVIHNISLPPDRFGGGYVQQLFTNTLNSIEHPYFKTIAELQVSAHVFIARNAEVTQFVSFEQRAWHAGASVFEGRCNCNDYSIGIELEGSDTSPFTEDQYACLVELAVTLMKNYPKITIDRIVGHSDIAPGRKTDPGECFEWQKFKDNLKSYLAGEA